MSAKSAQPGFIDKFVCGTEKEKKGYTLWIVLFIIGAILAMMGVVMQYEWIDIAFFAPNNTLELVYWITGGVVGGIGLVGIILRAVKC